MAVSIYIQSNYDGDVAMRFVIQKMFNNKRKHDGEAETLCDQCPVRDWFRNINFDTVVRISIEPKNTADYKILDSARRFLVEQKTWKWLWSQNMEKGKVASSTELVKQYVLNLKGDYDDDMVGFEYGPRGFRVNASMRKWCSRFKQKWQVRHGQLPEREKQTKDDIHDKAGSQKNVKLFTPLMISVSKKITIL